MAVQHGVNATNNFFGLLYPTKGAETRQFCFVPLFGTFCKISQPKTIILKWKVMNSVSDLKINILKYVHRHADQVAHPSINSEQTFLRNFENPLTSILP